MKVMSRLINVVITKKSDLYFTNIELFAQIKTVTQPKWKREHCTYYFVFLLFVCSFICKSIRSHMKLYGIRNLNHFKLMAYSTKSRLFIETISNVNFFLTDQQQFSATIVPKATSRCYSFFFYNSVVNCDLLLLFSSL